MTINEKLDLLRKEYVNATPGRKAGIRFQAQVLKRLLSKTFSKAEPAVVEVDETYQAALEIFKAEVKPDKSSELQTPVQRL
ncbi:MAG: hypothetical protein AAB922_07465 [Patescibacteria group bacterium]